MIDRTARRARWGVSCLFLTNAVVYASVVPRFPEIKAALALSNTQLGLAIAAGPLGALVAGLVATRVIGRLGSARSSVLCSVAMAADLLVIATAQNLAWLAVGLFVAGFCDSVGDVGNNLHGLRVQRRYGRSIINGFHGIWSVGAVLGGVVGSVAAGLAIPLLAQLAVVAGAFVVVSLGCLRWLLPGHDSDDRDEPRTAGGTARSRSAAVVLLRPLVVIGALAALAGSVEDSGASWGALYLAGTLGAGPGVAGSAFITMAVAMSFSRLVGDRFVNRYGERTVALVGAIVAAAGMTAALAVPSTVLTLVGFGLAGLGTATMIPAAMHAADGLVGLGSGVALTFVALITRLGFLLSPPLVGLVADAVGLRLALVLVPVAALGAFACARSCLGRATPKGSQAADLTRLRD